MSGGSGTVHRRLGGGTGEIPGGAAPGGSGLSLSDRIGGKSSRRLRQHAGGGISGAEEEH